MANEQRTDEYLISHTRKPLPASVPPLDMSMLQTALNNGTIGGVNLKKVIDAPPRGTTGFSLASNVPQESRRIFVASVDPAKVEQLKEIPQLRVEPNLPLRFPNAPPGLPMLNPSAQRPQSGGFQTVVQVVDANNQPLAGAEVYVFGMFQNAGVTDATGQVTISLFGELPTSIQQLYVKPKADCWDRLVIRPALTSGGPPYVVSLRPLSQTFVGFPGTQAATWGYDAIKLPQLLAQGGTFTGAGVKVAVVDSGAAGNTHQDLSGQVANGFDVIASTSAGWDNDSLSHGTHCAGVICGLDNNRGIRGIAPAAKLSIYKIFPGGAFDQLIDALDRCIQEGVDVVNMSLGADAPAEHVEEFLMAAKRSGIACIVAAGNSAGPVQFPATSRHVLSVAAIGKSGTYPPDSYHASQVDVTPDAQGYFPAKFSCRGPELGVSAPGVAVLSSVPPDNYASWDGTSMAAPHVAGVAALLLAHHPDFQTAPFNRRGPERVDRLFQILRATARPLGNQVRTGAGLVDVQNAFNQSVGAVSSGARPGSALSGLLQSWP